MGQRNKNKKGNKSKNGNIARATKCEDKGISQEQMIEIHAEAYYRALKRMEEEKNNTSMPTTKNEKDKWHDNILFFANVFFFPWKINKRFCVNKRICDSILVLFVSGSLKFLGMLMWLIGMVLLVALICQIAMLNFSLDMIIVVLLTLLLVILGSMFTLASKEFEKEVDSNKIYAYSASVIALISCVVSVIMLMKT